MALKFDLTKPSIFEYDDYRVFLGDLYEYYKGTTNYFSYRYFSRRAGFASPNFLKLVIEGKRNISDESIERFSEALKLEKLESEFFKNLVQFCQSKNATEKTLNAKRILKSRTFKKIHPIRQTEMKYYARWYYIPLRELVATKDFQEDSGWISEQFDHAVSPSEVEQALRDLISIGFIFRDKEGLLKQTYKNVRPGDSVVSTLISQYHKDMISKAKDSIDDIHHMDREISGTCISCSRETVEKIKTLMKEFRNEILSITDDSKDATVVYQLNFQLFPLAGQLAAKKERGASE